MTHLASGIDLNVNLIKPSVIYCFFYGPNSDDQLVDHISGDLTNNITWCHIKLSLLINITHLEIYCVSSTRFTINIIILSVQDSCRFMTRGH